MRLIDADAFIQMMEEKCDPESTLDPWVLSVCRGGVKMMPTVDAVPVVRGRWETVEDWDGDEYYKCSVCGAETFCDGDPDDNDYLYCPHCGARMDGEDGKTD